VFNSQLSQFILRWAIHKAYSCIYHSCIFSRPVLTSRGMLTANGTVPSIHTVSVKYSRFPVFTNKSKPPSDNRQH